MKVSQVIIRNFRRLEDVSLSLENDNTLFVGPNNSGKTSAATAFRLFFRRNDFTINDFSVSCIGDIDRFGANPTDDAKSLPTIEMDLWLSIDPTIEFGRVFSLLPSVSKDFDRVGIRLRYGAKDPELLRREYNATFPETGTSLRKPLSHFLSIANQLSRHFELSYFALEDVAEVSVPIKIEPEEGKRLLRSLVRVDFIDAQRNIHDQEGGRHNRLSAAFAAYYKHNLQKPAENEAASRVIDENNTRLTAHYKDHFRKLLKTISALGVPSAHDRSLSLVSALSPQEALQGSTELYYVDTALQHELPEAYNGLGFKNLVYMAIQISHFHSQWLQTEKNRELCQLIFVEEPEVHLHAQVQQVFIANIWQILQQTAADAGEKDAAPQLAISTHSSHIVDTVEFEKVRYFRRCLMRDQTEDQKSPLNATKVLNLRDFKPDPTSEVKLSSAEKKLDENSQNELLEERRKLEQHETLSFLKKYLKLTHCDLFFADAAVLVEGAAEKLLLSQMISHSAPGLRSRYVSVLEVGGAFAHKFSSLLAFLGIPYAVITDIDTVDPLDARKACRADNVAARSSNAALKHFLRKTTRAELVGLATADQVVAGGTGIVVFQKPVTVDIDGSELEMHARTFEEALIYENLDLFRAGKIKSTLDLSGLATAEEIRNTVYSEVKSDTFKKTEFALGLASSNENWRSPSYLAEGLQWLDMKLKPSESEIRYDPPGDSA